MTSVSFVFAKRRPHEEIVHVKSKISRTRPRTMMRSSGTAELASTASMKTGN
jgi:hypothetical protein